MWFNMKKAVIDIGTNSTRLLAGALKNGQIDVIYKDLITTRLGKGVHERRRLSYDAMHRTTDAIAVLKDKALNLGAKDIKCFATSAVRDAENRQVFIDLVEKETALEIILLSGRQEALAGYLGAVDGNADKIVLIDIGGGSTEIIWGSDNEIERAVSFDIGAVRLEDIYPVGIVFNEENWCGMKEYIDDAIKGLAEIESADYKCIGIGGTITTLAAIDMGMKEYDGEKIQGYSLYADVIVEIGKNLKSLNIDMRKKVTGLSPNRADIILCGISILSSVMDKLDVDKITVSDRGNLEGIMLNSDAVTQYK